MASDVQQSREFTQGQTVYYPSAPYGIAQVEEVRRVNVGILWICRTGSIRRKLLKPNQLRALASAREPLLPLYNPYGRAITRREIRNADRVSRPRHRNGQAA